MKSLLTIIFFMLITFNSFTQRVVLTGSSQFVSTVHSTCTGTSGSAIISLSVTYGIATCYVGAYTLNIQRNGAAFQVINSYTLYSSSTINVTIPGLPAGDYNITGSVSGYDPVTLTSYGTTSFPAVTFKTGYQVEWGSIKEMAVQTLPSSILQNVTTPTQTYAGARSFNEATGTCWVMASANFNSGNATNRSVFLSFSNSAALVSFLPSESGYLEFRKGGTITSTSGEGIYMKFSGFLYKLNGVVLSDRIRIERQHNTVSGFVKFYKNQSLTPLDATLVSTGTVTSQISVSYAGVFYNSVFTTISGDGLTDVAASTPCSSTDVTFANLEYELDGYYHVMKAGKIRFIFNNEYDSQANLKFNIYNTYGILVKTQANYTAIAVIPGDNYITIDATPSNGCLGRGMHYIEVINDKKEKFYLRFYNDNYIICPGEQAPLDPQFGG